MEFQSLCRVQNFFVKWPTSQGILNRLEKSGNYPKTMEIEEILLTNTAELSDQYFSYFLFFFSDFLIGVYLLNRFFCVC